MKILISISIKQERIMDGVWQAKSEVKIGTPNVDVLVEV